MNEEERTLGGDYEISPLDILKRLLEWWWVVVVCAAAGVLIGLAVHLSTEERFTVSLEMRIAESPLGGPGFLADIWTNFLRRQVAPPIAVQPNPRTGTISLVDAGASAGQIAARLASMQEAVSELRTFLEGQVLAEYEEMQRAFADEATPHTYASFRPFRVYLSAVEDGLLEPVSVVSQHASRNGLPLSRLLLAGAILGTGLGVVLALAAGAWRAMRTRRTAV